MQVEIYSYNTSFIVRIDGLVHMIIETNDISQFRSYVGGDKYYIETVNKNGGTLIYVYTEVRKELWSFILRTLGEIFYEKKKPLFKEEINPF